MIAADGEEDLVVWEPGSGLSLRSGGFDACFFLDAVRTLLANAFTEMLRLLERECFRLREEEDRARPDRRLEDERVRERGDLPPRCL